MHLVHEKVKNQLKNRTVLKVLLRWRRDVKWAN